MSGRRDRRNAEELLASLQRLLSSVYELRGVDGRPFLAYHWHPTGLSPVTTPHLHVGGPVAGVDLSKAHLPTGPVTPQDVLRLIILDLGVEPLRDDWRDVLALPVWAGGI